MPEEATHRWIIAMDVENFSSRRDPVQRRVRKAMYRVLGAAMERAGLAAGRTVSEDRGDGVLMLVEPSVSPLLLSGPFVRELDLELAEYAQESNEEHALRLRVALHQGLAARDDHGWSGDAVNTAFRIVDGQPLREVLTAAPSARMVFAVSGDVHHAVIRHGHRGIDPAAYLPCDITTKHGETISGWVTVPGYPAPPGLPAAATAAATPAATKATVADADPTAAPAAPAAAPAQATPAVTQHAGTVHGDQVAGSKSVTIHTTGSVRP
ncbi:hypothetical protein AB0K93_17865 [Streptomyces sp. NPDC052676]|uniref:hypothetical protein n=1 Tax=Streptomyces sp. NPDC052676 TaxID=3154953 RepID=UPI0034325E97